MPLSRNVPSFQDLTAYEKSVVEELRRRTFHDLTPKLQADETVFYRFCKGIYNQCNSIFFQFFLKLFIELSI
ncbi:UNVERIFIED_CONTAM: hypothetical protein NCL1_41805 [Trichonephila clavipes]